MSALWAWASVYFANPVNVALVITYATAVLQAVHAETGWRWAAVAANILSALPGLNIKGLLVAARKDGPK